MSVKCSGHDNDAYQKFGHPSQLSQSSITGTHTHHRPRKGLQSAGVGAVWGCHVVCWQGRSGGKKGIFILAHPCRSSPIGPIEPPVQGVCAYHSTRLAPLTGETARDTRQRGRQWKLPAQQRAFPIGWQWQMWHCQLRKNSM
jgi:hypothetical protein